MLTVLNDIRFSVEFVWAFIVLYWPFFIAALALVILAMGIVEWKMQRRMNARQRNGNL